MKLTFDERSIELDAQHIAGVERYAKAVMQKMQGADAEFADCWTGCLITFEALQPELTFGSYEDFDPDDGLVIHQPLDG